MKLFERLQIGRREVLLYLPPSYGQTDRRYPVAYVQDGGDLFTGCIRYLEHLFATGHLCELILVGIQTENRNDEYTPWPASPLSPSNGGGFGGGGKPYVDEIADVLKPYIDRHYRTQSGPEHTAIIGGSLGGLIAWFAGCWRPEVFGLVGLLSASLWYEGVMDFIRRDKGPAHNQRIYISVGGREGIYKTNAQSHMVRNNEELFTLLQEGGHPPARLTFVLDPGGTHDDLFMLKRFPEALQRLFDPAPEIPVPVQTDFGGGYSIPGTLTWRMVARNTGREYQIHLAVPEGPAPEDGYPVLYALDANASFGALAESMRLLSHGPHGIPPAVIVGIGYDSPELFATAERFRDYTVYADPSELPERPGGLPWPETGGADAFLDFMERQLKPAVKLRYPIHSAKQCLFGHSLGGFLTLYAMLSRRGGFQRYAAASPSIWWKNHLLFELWGSVKEDFQRQENLTTELLMAVGSEEKESMIRDAKELAQEMQLSGSSLRAEFRQMDGEGHVSIFPALLGPLLRFVTR
ncbi:alpha/beta hydrolase-fold protein [Paenibacillus sp. M1]|uniref:Alpha/beta hydrolase-fold protein n=1 Tax=Paenibacillus haidiansis TaxID=1574488 RepID=A0ABU7VV66_9BACL